METLSRGGMRYRARVLPSPVKRPQAPGPVISEREALAGRDAADAHGDSDGCRETRGDPQKRTRRGAGGDGSSLLREMRPGGCNPGVHPRRGLGVLAQDRQQAHAPNLLDVRRVPNSDRFNGRCRESASSTTCPSQGPSGNRCFPPDDASMEISGLRGQTAEKSSVVLECAGQHVNDSAFALHLSDDSQ